MGECRAFTDAQGNFICFSFRSETSLLKMMKVDLGIWDKLTWVATVLLLAAGVALVVGWYLPLINQNERMRHEILKLSEQIQQEEEASKKLKATADALQHDPKTIERLVRERLGYAKPGETVIRFEESVSNTAAH
jgi:cell division protein FtsB